MSSANDDRAEARGMRAAFDEVIADGLKRQHPVQRIVGDLLRAEIAEKQARSIKYQLTIARVPLAKDLGQFDFTGTPVNEGLVRDLATGAFLAEQRNAVLVGGTGTGTIWRSPSRAAASGRRRAEFFTVVDLVNRRSRGPDRPSGTHRRASGPARPGHSGRAWLPAVRPVGWAAAVPPDQRL